MQLTASQPKMALMRCSLQDVFDQHFDAFARGRSLHPRESRAAWCIRNCYTSGCGSHFLRCPAGHFSVQQLHACRHRSCPRCAPSTRCGWIDAQLTRLLPCPHFHVVFTLPHELLPLWAFNRPALTSLFFDCVRSTLLELMADPRHLGATPGLLLALHTWGRNLSQHPHIHALVSAGGLSPALRWVPTRTGFLLPLKPVQLLFSGKLLSGLLGLLDSAALRLPPAQSAQQCAALLQRLRNKHWNVQINAAYASGRSVTLYLARYAVGGPLPAQRPLFMAHGLVSLPYTDHRDSRSKWLHLPAHEFIARILWHSPAKGQHTVRHAGLYAAAARTHHRQALIALSCASSPRTVPSRAAALPTSSAPACAPACAPIKRTAPAPLCPTCATPLWRSFTTRSEPRNEISLSQFDLPRSTSSHLGPTHRSTGPPTVRAGSTHH